MRWANVNEEDISAVHLRILSEKAEDALERDHDLLENAARLARAVENGGKSAVDHRLSELSTQR